MSADVRNYVRKGAEQFLAVSYDASGGVLSSVGPYSTRQPASAARRRLLRRRGAVMARVEVATPEYEAVTDTELYDEARRALAESMERRSS